MKNVALCSMFSALCAFGANAAYPVYPNYQPGGGQNMGYQQPGQAVYQQPRQVVYQQPGQIQYQQPLLNQQIILPQQQNSVAAAPTRITGGLPRVGSNATNAGRQYYEPADYDRLADSGLYIGLSAAYSVSVTGGMTADYQGEKNSFFVPGAFQEAVFQHDTVIPLQISLGAAINNDLRVDFSYTRLSNIGYLDTVVTSDGAGGFINAQASGGAVTANATMLNIYYNIDSYTGFLAGGSMRPYIGVGAGISLNTIGDYVIYDGTFYSEADPFDPAIPQGALTGISDIYAYHNGGTTENLAYMLEGGVTMDLNGGLKLDFFARYSGVGNVKSSGSIVVSQIEWLKDDGSSAGETQAPYDSVFHYTNWYESGNLSTVDVGVRLRLQF